MSQDTLITLTSQARYLVLMLSMPAITVAAVVGLGVSLFQALTQIQEQTVSFAIKLIAIVVTLFATAVWLGVTLYDYSIRVFDFIPQIR